MRKSQISASMMCSNLVDLQATIDVFEKEKVEYLHIDVMDGEFVPNFGLGVDYIRGLRELGVSKLVMMTGDNEKTARAVAEAVGVDAYFAEVLPEDKAAFIQAEHAAGRKVIMLGDGVNDSPALSEADAGVAISDGAAIAREVADITVGANDLYALLTLKRLSDALMERIHSNYRKIISFNFLLICLGVAGVLPPATSALMHNASTLVISLKSMTKLLA